MIEQIAMATVELSGALLVTSVAVFAAWAVIGVIRGKW